MLPGMRSSTIRDPDQEKAVGRGMVYYAFSIYLDIMSYLF